MLLDNNMTKPIYCFRWCQAVWSCISQVPALACRPQLLSVSFASFKPNIQASVYAEPSDILLFDKLIFI